jgi:hypothetical protein
MTADGGDGLGARIQNIYAFKAAKEALRPRLKLSQYTFAQRSKVLNSRQLANSVWNFHSGVVVSKMRSRISGQESRTTETLILGSCRFTSCLAGNLGHFWAI